VARVELDALELVEVRTGGLHELDGTVDLVRDLLVAAVGRVLREAAVPAVHLTQVGEPTLCEGAHQIQRRRRGVVPLDQTRCVGLPRLGREVVAVHDVTAVGGQRDVAAGLEVVRAGLGELAGHAAHLHDGLRGAVREHDRHLQQRLHARTDLVGGCARECLGAVPTLQQERIAARRTGETLAQDVDLTREHERRQRGDLRRRGTDRVSVWPLRLVLDGQRPPIVETGDHVWIGEHNLF
jgi:hypothetical protein